MDPSLRKGVYYPFDGNASRSRLAAQMGLGDIER